MAKPPTSGTTLRKTWRAVVPPSLRKYGQGAAIALARRRVMAALAAGEPAPVRGPVVISGLVSGTKGVSRGARLTVEGVRSAGYKPIVHDLAPVFAASDGPDGGFPARQAGGVWLLHVNAPEAISALSRVNPSDWLGRYRIAYWAYELPKVPSAWVSAAEAFHEIWAPSRFVADALAASGLQRPIRVMPHPVLLGPPPFASDPASSDFVVLAMGDLKSSAARKNLVGAIEIYKRAFPRISPARRLILKVQSDDAHPEFRDAALAAAAGRGDILFRTGSVTDGEIGQLIAGSSVILSPHRSEGFGLVLAEAFLSGVPALATGWSGNVDFMSDVPELMIDYTLTAVRDPSRIYRAGGVKWAEPDAADAAAKLRALAQSAGLRRELAARGRAAVEAQVRAWSRDALAAMPFGRFAEG
jgi:glycosyltransferase involved in cell wall biosynthesis